MRIAFLQLVSVAALGALAPAAQAELMYGTTAPGFIISFDSATPGNPLSAFPLTGLESNEEIVGLDLRPATGQLFGMGSFGNIYTIDPATGQSTSLGAITGTTVNGASFGFDFNPTVDRIRVHSDTNQNLRLNPTVSPIAAIVDGSLEYAPGDPNFGRDQDVSFTAYSNNVAGAMSTTLYAIDSDGDFLVRLNSPNDGMLTTVGSLAANIGSRGGFDISGQTGIAYLGALLQGESTSKLFTVNLNTGVMTLIDEIAGGLELRTLTVIPTPGSIALAGLALVTLRRRR